MDDAMSEYHRRYDAVHRELEAAHAQLQTNPPDTLEGLILQVFQIQTLLHDRTDVVLDALLERVERLERRIESLGQAPP
jgi:hypothetical protein